MPGLGLHERAVPPVLDQMGDVAVTQTVRGELARKPEPIAVLGKPSADVGALEPAAAFGQKQRRMIVAAV